MNRGIWIRESGQCGWRCCRSALPVYSQHTASLVEVGDIDDGDGRCPQLNVSSINENL